MKTIIFITIITVIAIILTPAKAGATTIASKSATLTTQATIEPSLTFSIAGINDNTSINTGNGGCPNTERTNTGFSSSSTEVNLGRLLNTSTTPNLAAQLLKVTTNTQNGYVLTASSSGHLRNTSTNFEISDSLTPVAFPLRGQAFGIHPCGIDVPEVWRTNNDLTCSITSTFGNICKYAWPANQNLTLAVDSTGPSGNEITPGNGIISVSYAASINATVPGGMYSTIIRYFVTASF